MSSVNNISDNLASLDLAVSRERAMRSAPIERPISLVPQVVPIMSANDAMLYARPPPYQDSAPTIFTNALAMLPRYAEPQPIRNGISDQERYGDIRRNVRDKQSMMDELEHIDERLMVIGAVCDCKILAPGGTKTFLKEIPSMENQLNILLTAAQKIKERLEKCKKYEDEVKQLGPRKEHLQTSIQEKTLVQKSLLEHYNQSRGVKRRKQVHGERMTEVLDARDVQNEFAQAIDFDAEQERRHDAEQERRQ